MYLTCNIVILVVLSCGARAKPAVTKNSDASALYYLMETGWIHKGENTDTAALLSSDGLKKAIKDFQAFAGLHQSGDLDEQTVELMNTPRCGVPDVIGHGATAKRRRKRYALQGSRWSTNHLTYRIVKYPSSDRLSKDKVDAEVKKSFQIWADQTNLSFEPKDSGSVHIEILFAKGEHGDGDPFDGPGGTLAHAFFPQFGGDAHFDDAEYWTVDEFRGTNLLQTASHEFGHSLGLSHSDVSQALMAPFYRGWIPNLQLHKDDVDAIQALYGKKQDAGGGGTAPNAAPEKGPEKPGGGSGGGGGGGTSAGGTGSGADPEIDNADLCKDPAVDAIFNTADGNYYAFKGDSYWKLTEDSVEKGYPRKIADDWPGLPGDIDAAVTWPDNEMTFVFKGSEYWKFHNRNPEEGYPKSISSGFEGIPNNLDAAFVWGGNGKIYFIKGGEYYKFDPTRKPPVPSAYPRNLQNWDLPANIKTAVRWSNKYTYFFTDKEYYRFDDRKFTVDKGDPPFPRDIGPWWFGCKTSGGGGSGISTSSQHKNEAFVKLFVEEGNEGLDVFAGDEDK